MTVRPHLALVLLILILLPACGGSATSTPTPTVPALSGLEAEGESLFQGKGRCATCHALAPNTVIVGPSLAGIASAASTRVDGLSAAEYLEEAIIFPDSHIVEGFENQRMPSTLAKELTVEEVEALVAYMLTLE